MQLASSMEGNRAVPRVEETFK